jgi:hypothetical protein
MLSGTCIIVDFMSLLQLARLCALAYLLPTAWHTEDTEGHRGLHRRLGVGFPLCSSVSSVSNAVGFFVYWVVKTTLPLTRLYSTSFSASAARSSG